MGDEKPVADDVAEFHQHGIAVVSSTRAVFERPERAIQIAAICNAWALIEDTMVTVYALYMGITLPPNPMAQFPRVHPIAMQVFDTLTAFRPRLDLLRILTATYGTPDEKTAIEAFVPRLNNRYTERSTIAHGRWGLCESCPDDLILQRPLGGDLRYREHDFRQAFDRLDTLYNDLYAFMSSLYRRLGQRT